jgi:hypothetical protein
VCAAPARAELGGRDRCVHRSHSTRCQLHIKDPHNIASRSTCAFEGHRERSRWPSVHLGEGYDGTHQALSLKLVPAGASERSVKRAFCTFSRAIRDRLVGRTLSSELRNAGSNPAPGTEHRTSSSGSTRSRGHGAATLHGHVCPLGALFDNSSLSEVAKGASCSLRASTTLRARGDNPRIDLSRAAPSLFSGLGVRPRKATCAVNAGPLAKAFDSLRAHSIARAVFVVAVA